MKCILYLIQCIFLFCQMKFKADSKVYTLITWYIQVHVCQVPSWDVFIVLTNWVDALVIFSLSPSSCSSCSSCSSSCSYFSCELRLLDWIMCDLWIIFSNQSSLSFWLSFIQTPLQTESQVHSLKEKIVGQRKKRLSKFHIVDKWTLATLHLSFLSFICSHHLWTIDFTLD